MSKNNISRNITKYDKNSKAKIDTKIQKIKNTLEYKDYEINNLNYDLAIIYDKRSYCNYYISLLKEKHNLIFTFCGSDDYNSKIIKIDLFFIGFTIYYTVNALFYTDDTMHKIYEDEGSFNFIYQLPKIIYSSLISMVFNTILKLLALSNNDIISFKENKMMANVNKRGVNLENKLKIKFIMFFIIGFIFLLFFWYYISMFGAIYINTQLHLLNDTLISFGLSLIYPFIIYLIPGIFRLHALSNRNKNRRCLYKFSKFLQLF